MTSLGPSQCLAMGDVEVDDGDTPDRRQLAFAPGEPIEYPSPTLGVHTGQPVGDSMGGSGFWGHEPASRVVVWEVLPEDGRAVEILDPIVLS